MFIGSGFDTDGDGDNDIYVGGRVSNDAFKWILIPILVPFAILTIYGVFKLLYMLGEGFVESGAAEEVARQTTTAFWTVVSFVFWSIMVLLCVFAIGVMLLGIFYKEKK